MTTQDKIKVMLEKAIWSGYTAYSKNVQARQITAEEARKSLQDYNGYSNEKVLLDPDFFKALGKSCGWKTENSKEFAVSAFNLHLSETEYHALNFHKINLTQSFEAGIDYLYNLIEKK